MAPLAYVIAGLLVYWSGFHAIMIAIPSVFAGLLFLIIARKKNNFGMADLKAGIWLPIYLLVIVILSYLGSSYFYGTNLIPFPWDNVLFAIVTLVFYYWGYYSGMKYEGKGVVDAPA